MRRQRSTKQKLPHLSGLHQWSRFTKLKKSPKPCPTVGRHRVRDSGPTLSLRLSLYSRLTTQQAAAAASVTDSDCAPVCRQCSVCTVSTSTGLKNSNRSVVTKQCLSQLNSAHTAESSSMAGVGAFFIRKNLYLVRMGCNLIFHIFNFSKTNSPK